VLLTKRQRNAIFETLAANGLDPASCALQDPASRAATVASLRHEASGSSFTLWPDHDQAGKYGASMSVGSADFGRRSACDWQELMGSLVGWAKEIRYETETPDLWAELQQVPEILAAAQSAEQTNTPFTPDQQADVSRRIDQVKDIVRRENPELTAEQRSAIEETLNEIKEATTRVGRKDWVMLANGALLGLIVNDLVPPHVVQGMFSLLITGIGHIFGFGGPPPILGPQ
jgi:hypothetical protein